MSAMEVRVPTRVFSPLFELVATSTHSVHEQIQQRLELLVECGHVEGTGGSLYGTIRTHLGSMGEWVQVTIGLAFSRHSVEPYFREHHDLGYRVLPSEVCALWNLPTYEGPPGPPEPPPIRLSRYERDPVI